MLSRNRKEDSGVGKLSEEAPGYVGLCQSGAGLDIAIDPSMQWEGSEVILSNSVTRSDLGFKKITLGWAQWHTPVVPENREADAARW